jgi:hypothetical protein
MFFGLGKSRDLVVFGLVFIVAVTGTFTASAQEVPISPSPIFFPLIHPQFIYALPPVDLAGCTPPDAKNALEFYTRYYRLYERGLIAGIELYYAHLMHNEIRLCAREWDKATFCVAQRRALKAMEGIYVRSYQVIYPNAEAPLPPIQLTNVATLRGRCSDSP